MLSTTNSNEYQLTRVETVSCVLYAEARNPGSIRINLVRHETQVGPGSTWLVMRTSLKAEQGEREKQQGTYKAAQQRQAERYCQSNMAESNQLARGKTACQ